MNFVDLRSDTITQPTEEMRQAMANAPVGDDVYGEDPTINRLEQLSATRLGKEAALFVPSGTMGNLAAILAHCNRGDEVILGDKSHTFLFEAGGISALGGVHSLQARNQADGTIDLEEIRQSIRSEDVHHPTTRLISLENTHNRCGGVALTPEYMQKVAALAQEHGLKIHLDGARIFNAAAALDVDVKALVESADSVTFCLSKGLSAPVGSVLCGTQTFIKQAHRLRKQLGGGMRQAGILAAAGIVALETMVERLKEDHRHARRLADGFRRIPGLVLDAGTPASNMVFVGLGEEVRWSGQQVREQLGSQAVLVGLTAPRRFRMVAHAGVDAAGIDQAIQAFAHVMKQAAG